MATTTIPNLPTYYPTNNNDLAIVENVSSNITSKTPLNQLFFKHVTTTLSPGPGFSVTLNGEPYTVTAHFYRQTYRIYTIFFNLPECVRFTNTDTTTHNVLLTIPLKGAYRFGLGTSSWGIKLPYSELNKDSDWKEDGLCIYDTNIAIMHKHFKYNDTEKTARIHTQTQHLAPNSYVELWGNFNFLATSTVDL